MVILDRLLSDLTNACSAFPDKRKGEGGYAMADIGLSAFSLFFMQSEAPGSRWRRASQSDAQQRWLRG